MLRNIAKKVVAATYIFCILLVIILVMKMILYNIPNGNHLGLPQQVRRCFFPTPSQLNSGIFFSTLRKFEQNPFEISYLYENKKIYNIIKFYFPTSLMLGILALLLTLIFGFLVGLVSAFYENKFIDKIFRVLTFLGTCIPFFFIAYLINYIFSVRFNLVTCLRTDKFKYIIIPVISTLFPCMPVFINYMRESFIEILNSNYVQYAKAKGLSTKNIILKYIIKNSLIKVINIIPLLLVTIFTSLLIIENIFSIQGLSFPFISAIYNKDINLLLCILFFIMCIVAMIKIIIGILKKIISLKYYIKVEQANFNLYKPFADFCIYSKFSKSTQFQLIIINMIILYFSLLNSIYYYQHYIFAIAILIVDLIITTFLFYRKFKCIKKSLIYAFVFSIVIPICTMILFDLFLWWLWLKKEILNIDYYFLLQFY